MFLTSTTSTLRDNLFVVSADASVEPAPFDVCSTVGVVAAYVEYVLPAMFVGETGWTVLSTSGEHATHFKFGASNDDCRCENCLSGEVTVVHVSSLTGDGEVLFTEVLHMPSVTGFTAMLEQFVLTETVTPMAA